MGTRSDAIFEVVTRAIIDRRLQPGCKLSEQVLADIFSTSRAVVRQALIRLSDDNLVTMERNKGAHVSRPTMRDAIEIYDALTFLEQGVASQLSGRIGQDGWDKLRQHVRDQEAATENKDDKLADELGSGFHELLVQLSGNKVVQELHSQLIRRTALLRSRVSSRFDYCGLLHDHSALIDLLQDGKVEEARELIDLHHRNVVKGYLMDDKVQPDMVAREALAPYVALEDAA